MIPLDETGSGGQFDGPYFEYPGWFQSYFEAEEAKKTGAVPIALFTILPFYHKTGVAVGSGTFLETSYLNPDKIQADYHGFAEGYWYSPVMSAGLGRYPSPAVVGLDYNTPGYTMTLKWRSAMTPTLLAAASWQTVALGETVQVYAYYQWGVWWAGYRCWAQAPADPEDDYTAWAQPAGVSDGYDSYAGDTVHPFDSQAYIYLALLTGEFPVPLGDVDIAGQVTSEAPFDFSEIMAGDHTLILSNRHRDAQGQAVPRYSPHRDSFIFAGETDWFRRQLRIDFGYVRPGTGGRIVDTFLLYLGQIRRWGPLPSAVDEEGQAQPHTVEIYSKDWIAQALEKRIGLPDDDGNPQPLIYGEVLAEATEISGRGLGDPLKTAQFEKGTFDELDGSAAGGGGVLSINSITPLAGLKSLRAAVVGASQNAYGIIGLREPADELFCQMKWRFAAMPASPANDNVTLFKFRDGAGATVARFYVNTAGKLVAVMADGITEKESDWSVATHDGIRADLSLWVKCGASGVANVSLWVSGDQVLDWSDIDLTGLQAKDLVFGLIQGAAAESWTVDIDDIRLWNSYLDNAYQIFGGPFTEIKTVYVDKMVYSKSTIAKYPQYGVVAFSEMTTDDPPKRQKVSGSVMLRVVKNDLKHPVDIIEALLTEAGLNEYLNAAAFAAGKAATPDDVVGCRFEDMRLADAITEICSRCLYKFYVDHGEIKITPYLGTPPAAAELSLGPEELRETSPVFDMEDSRDGVMVKWGWFDRNPDLSYVAGDRSGGEAVEIDLTLDSPVATESEVMAKQKADALLKRLQYGREVLDPVRLSLRGARLELGDGVEISDSYLLESARIYEDFQKIVSLGPPYETDLRLARFLGE